MTHLRDVHYTRWPDVEGYCGGQSFDPGDEVPVHVASRSGSFSVEVTRVGASRDVVWSADGLLAGDHPVPADAWASGCDWPAAFSIPTESGWESGFYEVRFCTEEHDGTDPRSSSEAFFVLRTSDAASLRPLLVLSTNTWQAYNQWGGRCFYTGATHVSFARPLERGYLRRPSAPDEVAYDGRVVGTDEPHDPEHTTLQRYLRDNDLPMWCASSGWHSWERRFVVWAESNGIALDYAVNADLDTPARTRETLASHPLVVSVGHDEYWTWGMRDAMDDFVEQGGNWAIFSGNTAFWQVRVEDDGHTVVGYKGTARRADPVRDGDDAHLLTSCWADPRIGRPEAASIGVTFTRGGYHRVGHAAAHGTGGYEIHRPDHWALEGTDLRRGDELGSDAKIVGYEVDGCALEWVEGLPHPTGEDGAPTGATVIASAPARLVSITDEACEAPEALWASVDPPGDLEGTAMMLFGREWRDRIGEISNGHATMVCFDRGAGTVFNVATTDWCQGLGRDPHVERITRNVMERLA